MLVTPGSNQREARRKMSQPGHDVYTPDGFLVEGWRRVTRDGAVWFHRMRWRDDALLPFAGQRVYVVIDDPFASQIRVYSETTRWKCHDETRAICKPDVDEVYHRSKGQW